jgi:hypothetical protein
MTADERQLRDGPPISLTDSSGVLVVIAQEPRHPIATPHTPLPICIRDLREQQHVGLPLMIPFTMIVRDIFVQRSMHRALAKEMDLRQTLLFKRSYPAFPSTLSLRSAARPPRRLTADSRRRAPRHSIRADPPLLATSAAYGDRGERRGSLNLLTNSCCITA